MNDNTFTCDACRGVFEKEWTDEEAREEEADLFGAMAGPESGIVCEDCWQKIMGRAADAGDEAGVRLREEGKIKT